MIREIGSEFHKAENEPGKGLEYPFNGSLVFSGRTAIETVIRELQINKIIIPSYCCESMIDPFTAKGIQVDFFDVYYQDGLKINIAIPEDADAVLWCNYFGFHVEMPDLSQFICRGGIVIEDITHSFLSHQQFNLQSHYLIASLRKWEPLICGGYCAAVNGKKLHVPTVKPPKDFVVQKQTAMCMKQEYLLDGNETKKEEYLKLFAESNRWLADHYHGLMIDEESYGYLSNTDIKRHRKQRIKNAKVLYAGLEYNSIVKPLFHIEQMDCPLFVPVVLDRVYRDDLRKCLTANKIYCPIHWPHPKDDCKSNLYDSELSLICDQRYDETDMIKIISIINDWSFKVRRFV